MATPPMSPATVSNGPCSGPSRTALPPSAAKPRAVASPIPVPPPVMIPILPWKRIGARPYPTWAKYTLRVR